MLTPKEVVYCFCWEDFMLGETVGMSLLFSALIIHYATPKLKYILP